MKQTPQRNYDKHIFKASDIQKQIDGIKSQSQTRYSQTKWRIQNNQKNELVSFNIGSQQQNKQNFQINKVEKEQNSKLRKEFTVESPKDIVIESSKSYQILNGNPIVYTQEPKTKPFGTNNSQFFLNKAQKGEQRQRNEGIFHSKDLKNQIRTRTKTLSSKISADLSSNEQHSINIYNKRIKNDKRSFSLIDIKYELKNNKYQETDNELKQFEVIQKMQNEINIENQLINSYISPVILKNIMESKINENEIIHSQFIHTIANVNRNQKEQSQFSRNPKHARQNAKMIATSPFHKQPIQPYNQHEQFNKCTFELSSPIKKVSPLISQTEIESINQNIFNLVKQKSTEQYSNTSHDQNILQYLQSPPKILKQQQTEENIQTKNVYYEINGPLSRQISSKERTKRIESMIKEDEDGNMKKDNNLPRSIKQYYNNCGKSQKQLKILKHQEQILQYIQRSNSTNKFDNNSTHNKFNQQDSKNISYTSLHANSQLNSENQYCRINSKIDCSQHNQKRTFKCQQCSSQNQSITFQCQQCLQRSNEGNLHKSPQQTEGNECPAISLKNTSNRIETEMSPINKTLIKMRSNCDLSPNNTNWVSTQLPFQNSSYDIFSVKKKASSSQRNKEVKVLLSDNSFVSLNKTRSFNQIKRLNTQNMTNTSFQNSFNNTQLCMTGQLFGKTIQQSKSKQQLLSQQNEFHDEILDDLNTVSKKHNQFKCKQLTKNQNEDIIKLSTNPSQLLKQLSFNQSTIFSSKSQRITLTDRFKDNSLFLFEKQITDRTFDQTKLDKQTPYKTDISFKFRQNKNQVPQEQKQKFQLFLHTQEIPTQNRYHPKDTPISEIMSKFKLHEMKFQSKVPSENNSNLLQIYKEGILEKDVNQHNILNNDNYFKQQLLNVQQDQIIYKEYKQYSKVRDLSIRKPDGWFDKWVDEVDKDFMKASREVKEGNKTCYTLQKVAQYELTKKQKIRKSLLSMLIKFVKLNLSLKEVCANHLFVRGQFIRQLSSEFFEAVKESNLKDLNVLIKEDKYLVYSTDYLHQTPLHWAAKRGLIKILNRLLQLKTDVEALDVFGRTPLYYAYREGHQEIAVILMKNKACPWSDKQNDIQRYANHPSNQNIHRFYKIAKKVKLNRHIWYTKSSCSKISKVHLMITICPPKERLILWKDFKFNTENIY